MRARALAVAVLAAFVAGCGGDAPDEAPAAKGRLVVDRGGGIAGVQDRLVVRASGTGFVTHRDGPRERLTKADTREVRAALRASDFAGLDDRYEPEGVVADAFEYAFRNGGKTVIVVDAGQDVPDGLDRLQSAAAELLSE